MSKPSVWAAAACIDVDPEVFFPPPTDRLANVAAVEICKRCPITTECLQEAIDIDARFGVWGGLTETQRAQRFHGVRPAGRPLADHGSWGAYRRHNSLGEPPCDACRAFVATYSRDYYHRQRGAS